MWIPVLLASLGCYAIKYIGAAIPENFLEKPTVKHIIVLLPVSLLCALVAVQTLTENREIGIDARLPALLAATIALRFKAPFIVVVLLAAATATVLRSSGLMT